MDYYKPQYTIPFSLCQVSILSRYCQGNVGKLRKERLRSYSWRLHYISQHFDPGM